VATSAWLEVRVFPWRPRARVLKASKLRDTVSDGDLLGGADDVASFVIALAVWVAILIAAPVIVLVLAGLLFAVELPILLIIGAVFVLLRFAGVMPWSVVTVDSFSHTEGRTKTRNLLWAMRAVRAVNGRRRVPVRWSLS
jgi:hypothetical protein